MIQVDINVGTVLVWLGLILTLLGLTFSALSQWSAWRAGKTLDQLQRTVQELNAGALSQLLEQQSRAFEANLKPPGGTETSGSPSSIGTVDGTLAASSSVSSTTTPPQ